MTEARGDVWTIETKDRDMREIELLGAVQEQAGEESLRRRRQPPPPAGRAARRGRGHDPHALKYIPPERLIISTDCGFGRQGCNRDIAFFKAVSIAQGCNIVRNELGLATTYVPAADPRSRSTYVPKTAAP